MSVQENVQIVKDGFAAFGRGDMQGLLALFAEDILRGSFPAKDGRWPARTAGRREWRVFFQKIFELLEISFLEPREFVAQGDRVLVVGFDRGRVKATNKTFEGHWVMAFTVGNGKVTNVREYIDTLALAWGFEMAGSVAA
jgi:uncharacterized protein